jgi:apolipoprotein N-acyltransferase
MNFSRHTRVLLALSSGVALGLSFPNYNLSLLVWFAIGLLVLASSGARPIEAPLYGFLHGLIFYPVCVPWVATVVRQYGGLDIWSAAGFVGLIGLIGGLICSMVSLGVALASRKSQALACAAAPFLWVTAEFVRTRLVIFGSPWDLAGYAASGNLAFLQITTVTGIYGLSFLPAAYGSLVAYAIIVRTKRAWTITIATTAVLVLVGVAGGYLVPSATPHHVAHLVQTNFPQSERYPPDWLQVHAGELDQLEQISVEAARRAPGLIVWPEVPAPFSLQEPPFALRASRIARDSGSLFLVGVVDWKRKQQTQWTASNSAVLLDTNGRRIFTYDKIHLVPFGEYVPLRRYLAFAGRLTADIADFTPGTTYHSGKLPDGTFGVFICYEAIFPAEVRQFTAAGAELLITISNDGWFGRSSAPTQHLMMARVRAVENRRWMLRDTNNGFTVAVDPYGRIVARLAPDIRGQLDAPYDYRTDRTIYSRFGDWFAWLSIFVAILLVLLALMKKENGKLKMENGK